MKRTLLLLFFVLLLCGTTYSLITIEVNETNPVNLKPKAYDPDKDDITFSYTPPLDSEGKWQTTYGDAGEHEVKVTVSDSEISTSEDVLIVVHKREEPPVITSYSPQGYEQNINEGEKILFEVSASDLNNDELSYVWELDSNKVSETNSFMYAPDYDDAGKYGLGIYVSDAKSTAIQEWSVNVGNIDRPADFEAIGKINIKENQKLTILLKATDPDGEDITFSAEGLPAGSNLEGNTFTWVPGYDTVKRDSLVADIMDKYHLLSKTFTIKFFAESNNIKVGRKVKIRVMDVDRKPIFDALPDLTINEGDVVTIDAKAVDPDGDDIIHSYSGWMSSDSKKTNFGDAGTYKVKITAKSGWLTNSKEFNVVVKKTNREPIFSSIRDKEVYENKTLTIKLKAKDPDGDKITFSASGAEGISIDDNVFEWTPSYDIVASGEKENIVNIEISASDGIAEVTQTLQVKVRDVNRAPSIVSVNPEKSVTVARNGPVEFSVNAVDGDGDELSYEWVYGLFEKYRNAEPKQRRAFTATGNKKVKVIVSDGKKTAEHEWKVRVV